MIWPDPFTSQGANTQPLSSIPRITVISPDSIRTWVGKGMLSCPPATQVRSNSRTASPERSAGRRNFIMPMVQRFMRNTQGQARLGTPHYNCIEEQILWLGKDETIEVSGIIGKC